MLKKLNLISILSRSDGTAPRLVDLSRMKHTRGLLVASFLGVSAIVVFMTRRVFDEIVIWNLFPVIGAGWVIMAESRIKNLTLKWSVNISGVVMSATVLSLHLLWLFDVGKIASGSSTASLVFLFIPLWAFLVAFVAFCAALPVLAFLRRRRSGSAELTEVRGPSDFRKS